MSSQDNQDPSYSPATFDLWDSKTPSLDNELRGTPPTLVSTRRRGKPPPRGASNASLLPSLQFPKFPTIFELARTAPLPPAKTHPPGLFEMYMNKEPGHILQDATTENRYDDQALSLLGDLQQGNKKWEQLTPEERGMLDEAALEFFHPPKKIQPKPLPSSLAPSPPTVRTQDGELPRVDPVEGPVMDAFWWAK